MVQATGNVANFFLGPRGKTGNVDVAFSNNMVRAGACLWPVQNLASLYATGEAQSNAAANTLSGSISCEAGGAILGMYYNGMLSGGVAWSNLTERFELTLEGVALLSGASQDFATAQVNRSISAGMTGNFWPVMTLIAIR